MGARDTIAADTETTSLKFYNGQVVGHCFASYQEGHYYGFYVPVRHADGGNFDGVKEAEETLAAHIYENPNLKKIFWNMKFDIGMLKNHGIDVVNAADGMILTFLRNENERNHQLKHIASTYIDRTAKEEQDRVVKYFKDNDLDNYGQIPVDLLGPYGAQDAVYTLAIWNKFQNDLISDQRASKETDGVRRDILEHELKFTHLAGRMERTGVPFDPSDCEEMAPQVSEAANRLKAEIMDMAAEINDDIEPCNFNSDTQMAKFMEALNFKPVAYSWKTGKPSWGKVELMEIGHPIGELLSCYRNLTHNLGTFIEGLPEVLHNGRLYCSYNQIGTRTGRASCSDPNLQQIPARFPRYTAVPEYGIKALRRCFDIRKSFRAPAGYSWLKIDESQFELRLLDHYAQDEFMHQAFLEGRDIHAETACRLFNFKYEEFVAAHKEHDGDAKQFRDAAKECNFAIVYGSGFKRLHKTLAQYGYKFQLSEVRSFFYRYFEIFPGIRDFVNRVQATVRKRGYIFNYYGRHKRVRANKAYVGVNYLIQGVTADMLKDAMYRVDAHVLTPEVISELILAVHDESDFLIHDDEHHLIPILKAEMEDFPWCRTPIKADVEIGPSWGELETWSG